MGDDAARRRAARRRPEPEGVATAAAPPRAPGQEPPDVIEVVFPVSESAYGATSAASGAPPRWRERPLLLGGLALTVVVLAAALAWQVWPRSPDTSAADRGRPARVSAQLPGSGGLSARGAPVAGRRTLAAGDSGPDVTELQRVLFDQGFTYVSATGVFDDATVRGVKQAQRNRALTCDPPGVYGACTRAALTP